MMYSTLARSVERSPLRRETRVQFPAGSACSSVGQATHVQPPSFTLSMFINEYKALCVQKVNHMHACRAGHITSAMAIKLCGR